MSPAAIPPATLAIRRHVIEPYGTGQILQVARAPRVLSIRLDPDCNPTKPRFVIKTLENTFNDPVELVVYAVLDGLVPNHVYGEFLGDVMHPSGQIFWTFFGHEK